MNTTLINNQVKRQLINEEDEIDLIAVWYALIQKKWTIFKLTCLFSAIGTLYAFFATPYYQSAISLYPAGDIAEPSSNLQGIAESFGFGGLNSAPTYHIPDIIDSRRLKKDIILKSWPNRLYPNGSNLIKFWEIDKKKWFSPGQWLSKLLPPGNFPAKPHLQHIETAIEHLSELISVDEEDSGLITVLVLMEEPELAADIANYIATFLIDFILVEQHKEAEKHKSFIYEQQIQAKKELALSEDELTKFRKHNPIALDTPDLQLGRGRLMRNVETNQAVYITLRQQYEIARLDEAKENLLVNILDVAEPAVSKTKPRRKMIVILSIILGAISGAGAILIRSTINTEQ